MLKVANSRLSRNHLSLRILKTAHLKRLKKKKLWYDLFIVKCMILNE